MSNQSGAYMDLIYGSTIASAAKSAFTAEVKLNDTATMGPTPLLLPEFWMPGGGVGRGFRVVARGILSTTLTPTFTFTLRLGAENSTSSAIALGSAAITTGSTVTNQMWEFEGDFIIRTMAAAGASSTGVGVGMITSGGFASPFTFPLWGAAATPGAVATVDHSIANYFNFNVACSANSASNIVQLQQLIIFGL